MDTRSVAPPSSLLNSETSPPSDWARPRIAGRPQPRPRDLDLEAAGDAPAVVLDHQGHLLVVVLEGDHHRGGARMALDVVQALADAGEEHALHGRRERPG
jgi:hypothetical protein